MTKHFNEDLDDKVLRKAEDLEHKVIEMTEPEFVRAINLSFKMFDANILKMHEKIYSFEQIKKQLVAMYNESVSYQMDSHVKYFYDETEQGYYIEHTKKDKIGF